MKKKGKIVSEDKTVMGHVFETMYDSKIDKLDVCLVNRIGTPIISFQKYDTNKVLFELHLKEAIELKAIIDRMVVDYMEEIKQFDEAERKHLESCFPKPKKRKK